MMDLVYILGTGSRWQDNEIRYSLRSVERYVPGARVFVVGSMPAWLTGVEHVPCKDVYPHKLKNAFFKIRQACLNPAIGERFVLMNDDFIFLRPVKEFPTCNIGTLAGYIQEHPTQGGYYYHANVDTLHALRAAGMEDPVSYEAHTPMVLEKKKVMAIMKALDWKETGYLLRSVYGNTYPPERGRRIEDVKIYDLAGLKKLKNGAIISMDDHVIQHQDFQEWIMGRFPDPSCYEAQVPAFPLTEAV
jgi:hypothetical protein